MIAVLSDSTGSLTKEMANKYGIILVPYYVIYGGRSYKEDFGFDYTDYYQNIMIKDVLPTTSQPSTEDFAKIYEEVLKTHDNVIHFTISNKLSKGYGNAKKVSERFGKDKIYVYDSLTVLGKQTLLAMEAAQRRDRGEGMQEIIDGVKSEEEYIDIFAVFDTLKYLAKGGRIGKAQALVGGLLSIKPILTTQEGLTTPVCKVRTPAQGLNWIIEKIKKEIENTGRKKVFAIIEDALNDEWANKAEERLRDEFDIVELIRTRMSVVTGTHIGPKAWDIAYHLLPE
ncbi:DegV family protein [candidate division WOR-3 bacterium]|nr:DegV family protein [candidate division WOR-3 bacterium]